MRRGLLLGAGFSFDLGMPLALEVTETFLGMFNPRDTRTFGKELSRQQPYTEDRPIDPKGIEQGLALLLEYKRQDGGNYEELLSQLEGLPWHGQRVKDAHNFLFSRFYVILYEILLAYQRESYALMYGANSKYFSELENILSDNGETWVFTLNHDLYLESLAIDQAIPVTYGDTDCIQFPLSNVNPEKVLLTSSTRSNWSIDGSGWFTAQPGINLVRLHGGFAELEYKDKSILCNPSLEVSSSAELMSAFERIEEMAYYSRGRRIPSGRDRIITGPDGTLDIIRRALLTGGNKYSKTTNHKVGEEKLHLFDSVLRTLDELTIIGYGFGDLHVNFRISNAMVLNENLKLKIVDPVFRPKPEFLVQFDYGDRIRGGQCGAAEWLPFARGGRWNSSQIAAIKENQKLRAEVHHRVREKFHSLPNKPLLLTAIVDSVASLARRLLGPRSFTPFGRGGRSV